MGFGELAVRPGTQVQHPSLTRKASLDIHELLNSTEKPILTLKREMAKETPDSQVSLENGEFLKTPKTDLTGLGH